MSDQNLALAYAIKRRRTKDAMSKDPVTGSSDEPMLASKPILSGKAIADAILAKKSPAPLVDDDLEPFDDGDGVYLELQDEEIEDDTKTKRQKMLARIMGGGNS